MRIVDRNAGPKGAHSAHKDAPLWGDAAEDQVGSGQTFVDRSRCMRRWGRLVVDLMNSLRHS